MSHLFKVLVKISADRRQGIVDRSKYVNAKNSFKATG